MDFTCRLMSDYFFPMAEHATARLLDDCKSSFSKVKLQLMKPGNPWVSRSTVMKNVDLLAKDMDDIIDTLKEAGVVDEIRKTTSHGHTGTYYRYIG